MTPEELLGLLDLSRGSSPDPLAQQKRNTLGYERARPSMPMPSAPVTPVLDSSQTSPFQRMDASGMGDAGILERIGSRAPQSGIAALIDLTGTLLRGGHSGYGDAVKRAKLNAASDTLTQEHTDTRLAAEKAKKERDAAVIKERKAAMEKAADTHLAEIRAINAGLLVAHPQETNDALKERRMKHKAALQKLKTDYNALTGQELLAADVPDDTELPGVTPKPEKPSEPKADAKGPWMTVQTPNGPKLMQAADAAAQGFVSTGTRDTRVPSATEREQLVGDIGMLGQVNRIREAFDARFVGPARGRAGAMRVAVSAGKPGEATFRSSLAAIRNQIMKLRSGAAVTEGEAARLLDELPTEKDPSEVFADKLNTFETLYRSIAESRRQMFDATGVDTSKMPPLPPPYRGKQASPGSEDKVQIVTPDGRRRMVPRSKLAEAIRRDAREVR